MKFSSNHNFPPVDISQHQKNDNKNLPSFKNLIKEINSSQTLLKPLWYFAMKCCHGAVTQPANPLKLKGIRSDIAIYIEIIHLVKLKFWYSSLIAHYHLYTLFQLQTMYSHNVLEARAWQVLPMIRFNFWKMTKKNTNMTVALCLDSTASRITTHNKVVIMGGRDKNFKVKSFFAVEIYRKVSLSLQHFMWSILVLLLIHYTICFPSYYANFVEKSVLLFSC